MEFLTTSLAPGVQGEAYSATLEAAGGTEEAYRWAVTSGELPGGLVLRSEGTPSTRISGTPTGAGTFTFTVEVKDSKNTTATSELTLEIAEPPPPLEITTAELPNGGTEMPYEAEIIAANGSGEGYRWRLTAGTLPPGVTLAPMGTPSTTLSGTPPAGSFGDYDFTIEVQDSANNRASASFSVAIVDDSVPLNFVTQDVPDGEENLEYTATLEIAGGSPEYSWRVRGGEMPPGIELDATANGTMSTLSGTPSMHGQFTFQIEVRDSGGETTRKTFFMEIAPEPPPIRIVTPEVPPAEQGETYEATLSAINGTGEGYTWSIVEGALPNGLALAAMGTPDTTISGTPTEFGSFDFTIQVADSRGNTDRTAYTLNVQEEIIPITIAGATNGTIPLPNAEGGADYQTTITAQDGFGRYNWVVSDGRLPDGLTLTIPGTPDGVISGIAQELGTFTATVTVYDLNNDTASVRVVITVDPPSTLPTIETPTLPDAAICGPYTQRIFATGGSNANYQWSVVSGSLPPSFVLSPTGTPSATISGGTGNQTGTYTFTIRVTDTFGLTDEQQYTVNIADIPGGFRWVAASNDIGSSGVDRLHIMEVCGTPGGPALEVTPSTAPSGGDIYSASSAFSVGFSPDGRAIAYVGDLATDGTYDVFIVPLVSGAPGTPINVSANLQLSGSLSAVDLRWSPDGTKLAFRADASVSGAEELFVVDVTDVNAPGPAMRASQQFSSSSTEVYVPDYHFSPDSTKIAYIADTISSQDRLFVVDLSALPTGGAPGSPVDVHPSTNSSTDVYGTFLWTNDSGALIYTADMTTPAQEEVWWVDVSGTVPGTPLSLSPNMPANGDCYLTTSYYGFLELSPDGTKLAMLCELEVDNGRYPYIVDLSGPTPSTAVRAFETTPTANLYGYTMRWSPDSTKLAFTGDFQVDNQYEAFVVDTTGVLPATLHRLDHPGYGANNEAYTGLYHSLVWSPDSRWIGMMGDLDLNGPYQFYVADTLAGPPYDLVKAHPDFTSTSEDIWNVQFSPDSTKAALFGYTTNPSLAYTMHVVQMDNLGVWDIVHPVPSSTSNDMATLTTSGWSGFFTHFWTADSDSLVFMGEFATSSTYEAWQTDVSGPPPYSAQRITPTAPSSSQEVYRIWGQGPYARRRADFWRY